MPFAIPALRRLLAAGLLWLPLAAAAATFQVSIETTPLDGQMGHFAFDLYQGDPATTNEVQVSSFSTPALLGTGSAAGDATGDLLSVLTLRSTGFFNEYLQPVVFAAGVTSFRLETTDLYLDGNIPDSFVVFLLDETLRPYATSDPTGAGALIALDLLPPVTPQVFASDHAVAAALPVPEPGSQALMAAGLLALGLLGGRRSR